MDRERVWLAHIFGDRVTVRHYAVLEPGEDLVDKPPAATMTRAEWEQRHLEFDCNLDGSPRSPRPGVGTPAV